MIAGKARSRVVGITVISGIALVMLGLFGLPAQAKPTVPTVQSSTVTAAKASHQVGADTGSFYVDDAGHAIVNVTNEADAATVRAQGVRAKVVDYSYATLMTTKNRLDRLAGIRDTSWGIDTSTDQVVVTISTTTPKAGADKLLAAVKPYGKQVRVERTTGTMEVFVRGGDAIQNSVARCSAGFNVRQGGQLMVLTAGHCTELGGTWSPMGGTVAASDSPGADSGLITNPSGNGPSEVNTGQPITSIGSPFVGEGVAKSGSTTGVTTGTVSAVEQTVNFDVGVIRHLFATNVHSDHGDSGGPAYDGSVGLGTLTGGNTVTTFFYPAAREFSMYGLTLP